MSEKTSPTVSFPVRNQFDTTIRQRIDAYFKEKNIQKTGSVFLHFKASLIFLSIVGFYFLLLFKATNIGEGLLYLFFLVQLKILLAFNVMHDASHNSFSKYRWLNYMASLSMEFLGSSNMLWKEKHNSLHHTYTNIDGKDDDLNIGSLMRLAPSQDWKPWHRYQAFYAPILYCFLSLYLLFYSDFERIFKGKIGETSIKNKNMKEVSIFLAGKFFYFFYTIIIPTMLFKFETVLFFFIIGHFLFGLTLSIIFQLAHTIKETEFLDASETKMPYSWVEHQLRTTANFAVNNKFLTFYCGGLNFQVEHHLFHMVSHVHYPKISQIIKDTCQEFGKPYYVNHSFFKAIKSHFLFLHQMSVKS